jgi:hypothetical protein
MMNLALIPSGQSTASGTQVPAEGPPARPLATGSSQATQLALKGAPLAPLAQQVKQAAAAQGIKLSTQEATQIAVGLGPKALSLSLLKVASGATFGALLSVLLDARPAGNPGADNRAGFSSLAAQPEQTPRQLAAWVARWSPTGADNPTMYRQLGTLYDEFMSGMSRAKAGDSGGLMRATTALRTWWEATVSPLDEAATKCISRIVSGYLRHLTGASDTAPAKAPTKSQAEPPPVPKSAVPTKPFEPAGLTQQERREAKAQGDFLAQISFNKAANARLNEVVDSYRQDYARLGGQVTQLYHKVGAGEAGLGELKTARNELQALWNRMTTTASALNGRNGPIDLLSRANSNAQSLVKQWPALRQDPDTSARLKSFAGDLSNAKGWAEGLQGLLGTKNPAEGLRGFITATDRYIQQAEAYRQGAGPKPVLPDFKQLTNSGLGDAPAARAAVKAMSDGYASASKWLSSWLPQRAQPKLTMPPAQFDVPGANGGWRAQALDGVPAGMKEVAKASINVRTGEVSATPKTGPGWVEMTVHQSGRAGDDDASQDRGMKNETLHAALRDRIDNGEPKELGGGPPKKPPPDGGKRGGGWLPNPDNWVKWFVGLTVAGLALQATASTVQTVIQFQSKETQDKQALQQTRVYQLTERMNQAEGMPIKVTPYPKALLDKVANTYTARADALIKVWQHYTSQAGAIIKGNPAVFGTDAAHHSELAQQFQVKARQFIHDELSRLRKGTESEIEASQKEALGAMATVGFPPGGDGLPALAIGANVVEQRAINRIAQQLQLSARASLPSLGSFQGPVDQGKINVLLDPLLQKAGAGSVVPSTNSGAAGTPVLQPPPTNPRANPSPLPTPALPPKAAKQLSDARAQLTSLHGDAMRLLFPSAVPAAFARAPSFPTTLQSLTAAGGTEREAKDRARPLFLETGSNTSGAGTVYQRLFEELRPVVIDLNARYPNDQQVQQLYRDTQALLDAATKLGAATNWVQDPNAAAANGEPAAAP